MLLTFITPLPYTPQVIAPDAFNMKTLACHSLSKSMSHGFSTALLTHIGNLAHSSELKRLLEGGDEVASGFHAVAKLAWGVMLRIVEQDNHQAEGGSRHCSYCSPMLLPCTFTHDSRRLMFA